MMDWIDVNEKRPENDLRVLCSYDYCGKAEIEIGRYVGYADYSDGTVYLFKNDNDEYISCEKWKYIE